MKKTLSVFLTLLAFCAAGFSTGPTAEQAAAVAVPAPSAVQTDMRDWTVMVFMNARNNLQQFAERNIGQMKEVGSTDKVAMVVELGIKDKSTRFLVTKGGQETISTTPNADMGDYRRVIEFMKMAKAQYPAKHYMLVLWNHGLGQLDPAKPSGVAQTGAMDSNDSAKSRGISFDDESGNYIRTPQLKKIFEEAGGVDVYASNACLMQMAEVAYELKDHTKAIVGSEEVMLASGFNYTRLLNLINKNTEISPINIGRDIVQNHKEASSGIMNGIPLFINGVGATMSVIDSQKLVSLPAFLNKWTKAMVDNKENAAITYAITKALRFKSPFGNDKKGELSSYVDLYDFVNMAEKKLKSEEAKMATAVLKNYIDGRLVAGNVGMRHGYDVCKGLAITMTIKMKPYPAKYDSAWETPYNTLDLSKDSTWDEFIDYAKAVYQGSK